jgi:hypothetical protein
MHSDFVVTLRRIEWEKSKFPNAEEILFAQYCEIQKLIKRKALSHPKLLKQFVLNTIDEIDVEQRTIETKAGKASQELKKRLGRKDKTNRLSPTDLKELKKHEEDLRYFSEILTTIFDAKATLLEYLAAYHSEYLIKEQRLIVELRNLLPVFNLYRQKIENLIINDDLKAVLPKEKVNDNELSKEVEALQIIGKLNFEKACQIICEGIGSRMPTLLSRVKKMKGLPERDRIFFQSLEELSKEEIIQKYKENIYIKRDAVVDAYTNVFAKIDQNSADPEFTKQLSRKTIYENVISKKENFISLRQYPSDWSNETLFSELWAYSILVLEWHLSKQKKGSKNSINLPSFQALFNSPEMVGICVEILRKVEPPLIDSSNNFIGRSKGTLCVWIDEMKRVGIIKNIPDRRKYSHALNNYFKDFIIDPSMFAKTHKRAEEVYQKAFRNMLAKIKLSQDSQL